METSYFNLITIGLRGEQEEEDADQGHSLLLHYYIIIIIIQGHRRRYQSKARMRLPISGLIVTDILSHTVAELSQLIVQILDTFLF